MKTTQRKRWRTVSRNKQKEKNKRKKKALLGLPRKRRAWMKSVIRTSSSRVRFSSLALRTTQVGDCTRHGAGLPNGWGGEELHLPWTAPGEKTIVPPTKKGQLVGKKKGGRAGNGRKPPSYLGLATRRHCPVRSQGKRDLRKFRCKFGGALKISASLFKGGRWPGITPAEARGKESERGTKTGLAITGSFLIARSNGKTPKDSEKGENEGG